MRRLKSKEVKNAYEIKVKECKPIFYKDCICCEYQYKNEPMWKTSIPFYTSQRNMPDILYICKKCISNRNDVEKYLEIVIKEGVDAMQLLSPPSKGWIVENKILFLAGAIQGAADWQSKIIDELKNCDISIANPRKKYLDKEFDYEKQVEWESYFLKEADIIIFWLPKETETIEGRAYAQTSRFELGEWLAKQCFEEFNKKIIVGVEDGFSGKRYIQTRMKNDYEWIDLVDTFKELISKLKESL